MGAEDEKLPVGVRRREFQIERIEFRTVGGREVAIAKLKAFR